MISYIECCAEKDKGILKIISGKISENDIKENELLDVSYWPVSQNQWPTTSERSISNRNFREDGRCLCGEHQSNLEADDINYTNEYNPDIQSHFNAEAIQGKDYTVANDK